MTRITAGTDIYLSAPLFSGLPGRLLDLALTQAFRLFLSPELLDELDDRLRNRFLF